MMKKTGLVVGAIALLLGLIFGRETFSYIGTFASGARSAVRDAVPVEFEIKRARDMVKQLAPEIEHNMHLIAKEEVGVERLKADIKRQQEQLTKNRTDIERLTNDLKRGESNYAYAGVMYTSKQVESDLSRRFEVFKDRDVHVAKLKELVGAREQRLIAAREKLREMKSAKEQLLVEIEQMETRLAMVKVAQTSAKLNIDDSTLSRTRQLIDEISTKIDVQEKLVGAETSGGNIALEEPTGDEDITQRVTAYFNGTSEEDSSSIVKLD